MLPPLLDLLPLAIALWLLAGVVTIATLVITARKPKQTPRPTVKDLLDRKRETLY